MAEIRPFKGLRFDTEKAGSIEKLVCPPYDIISEEQRLSYIKENENNIIRLELPKGETPYETAGSTLNDWLNKGILRKDDDEAVYIYEEEFTAGGITRSFKGCIVRVKLEEFSKGIVLPHEETLSKAKEDRFNLMKATNCNFSQIYSLYMDEKHEITSRLDKLSKGEPLNCLTDNEGVTHRLWAVTDKAETEAISKLAVMSGEMRKLFSDNQYLMLGNHDNNYQGVSAIDNDKLVNVIFPKQNEAYYKFSRKNTDFYVFDTGSDWDETMNAYRWEQVAWLGNALKTNTAEHIAIAMHIWWNTAQDTFSTPMAENIAYLVTAFNKRISTTLNGVTYNYSNVSAGRIEFVITGHTHIDNNTIIDNTVPVISTLNAYNSSAVSFDMIFADYTAKEIYLTRVGTGSSRGFSLETGQSLT